jgi:hypothetical protein
VKQLVRDLVLFAITAWLLLSETLNGQCRNELRQKYSEQVSERFMVRRGITVTATFSTNGRIIELLISPQSIDLIRSRGQTLSVDSVNAIIDELVPPSVRDKHLIAGFINGTCLQ